MKTYREVGRLRLMKLADHLEKGQLGHRFFDFSVVNRSNALDGFDGRGCGTSGCAIGELPIVFPDEWMFNGNIIYAFELEPVLKNSPHKVAYENGVRVCFRHAAEFFGTTEHETSGLFAAYYSREWSTGELDTLATREKVAQGIREFIAWKDRQ